MLLFPRIKKISLCSRQEANTESHSWSNAERKWFWVPSIICNIYNTNPTPKSQEISRTYRQKDWKSEEKWYAGLNENDPHRLSVIGTFRRCGIVGVVIALLGDVLWGFICPNQAQCLFPAACSSSCRTLVSSSTYCRWWALNCKPTADECFPL